MRIFAHKRKPTQEAKSASSARHGRAFSGQSREVSPILHLQRTIGNQAVQRLLRTSAEDLEVGSATTASGRFGHDLSQIPLHPKARNKIQPKLTVSTPGDMYEQEAARVADQVMRMPEPHLKHTCACGSGCPKCQVEQQGQENQFVQRSHISANDARETEAPRIVNKVVNSLGKPLDSATTAFFEPRFRHDFSQVRVHTDIRAAESARALNARAFTLGSNIVFGVGLYEPETSRGRRLIAHELTHVVQQNQTTGQHIQRQEDNEKDSRFKRVPPGPGAYTGDEYKEWLRLHPDSAFSSGGPWEPKSFYARYTPEWFLSRGYFYSGRMYGGYRGARIEVWLSNEGKGKEFRVFRGPEKETRERTQEAPISFEVADIRDSIESVIKDNKRMDDLYEWLKNHIGDPQYVERYKGVKEWSRGWPYHSIEGPTFLQVLEENILDYMEGVSDEELPLLQRELERLQDLKKWRLDFYNRLNKLPQPSAPQ